MAELVGISERHEYQHKATKRSKFEYTGVLPVVEKIKETHGDSADKAQKKKIDYNHTSHFATSKQLSILQCNINGLCSTATKIKLEEIMEKAEKQRIQIIALQETKLNEKYNLKYKNYNILRKDRNKEEGGLAFLIKNLYYEDIAINIPNTSDLEAQEISTKTKTSSIKEKFWNFKKANWNLYQQNTNEDFRKTPTRIKDLEQNWISFKNTIIKAAKVSIPRENNDLNKTPGPDGIHGQMISNLGKNGKERLLDIFNNSWKTGKLPQDWKTATIIPIKKLDKSADDPKNYRPISLTSICSKLMEKIILRRDSPTTSTQEISYQKNNMDLGKDMGQ
ncbi:hypothetical protein LAZ67_2005741 [Cordylochernes scorpioides]|uniref:Uncharacterized protein n=1 Tax=Cordylochernes scorpioides TaxID=51811 RepID=A0ABY6K4T7_9ARAC|nr:hypothetical protein LAZ67_2005741 [Cordylochernes scorpioides]